LTATTTHDIRRVVRAPFGTWRSPITARLKAFKAWGRFILMTPMLPSFCNTKNWYAIYFP
jgi:hypothetical protein